MSDNFISNNNNFISNNNNNRGRRRNFQGSLPSTNYQMPENFAQKDIQFPKAPSLGQFTPSNSGIKRDWSGSEMQVPEFKGLNAVGKGLQGKAKDKRAKQIQDEKDKKPMKVTMLKVKRTIQHHGLGKMALQLNPLEILGLTATTTAVAHHPRQQVKQVMTKMGN